jgi:hypothetical protein
MITTERANRATKAKPSRLMIEFIRN